MNKMIRKLYYTVDKETQTIDIIEECTGWKKIQVYYIVNDKPKQWFDLEVNINCSSEEEIQSWLIDNGFGDREYDMIWL